MRKVYILLFLLLIQFSALSQDYRAMTYNIRYDNPGDGENRWDVRKEWLSDQIRFHKPDILGIQEGLHHQVEYLKSRISTYDFTGVGRDDGKTKGEFAGIFYNKEKLELVMSNTFWLSTTPEKVSVGWDASMERICTYALFRSAQGPFWVFNTHFDHIGMEARKNSSELIVSKINELNKEGYPVILMGDLNLIPVSPPIVYLSSKMEDSALIKGLRFGPEGTWNGFDHTSKLERRIDYIFTKGLNVKVHAVISDSKNNRYPSDHLPVLIDFELRK